MKTLFVSIFLFFLFFLIPKESFAQTGVVGDANGDRKVDGIDYIIWLTNYNTNVSGASNGDFNNDGKADGIDYISWLTNYGLVVTATPAVTNTPIPTGTQTTLEWTQFGHDAQRTSYTSQSVATPWKYKWQWNGAGADGKKQAGHLSVPDLVQPITGGGRIYMPAANTLYALNPTNGSQMWTRTSIGTLASTAIYDQENIYIASGNSILYKLDAVTGAIKSQFTAASALNLAPLLSGNYIYVVSANGVLYKIDKNTMTKVWEYSAGSPGATPASFSQSKDMVILVSQDLFVHGVRNTDGTRAWRVKPTIRTYTTADPASNLTEALEGWPVIAEQHGMVFVRYRLEWQTLFDGPGTNGTFPTTNAAARTFLINNAKQQALFALNITDGSTAFVPNAGNGGAGDGGYLPMGPQPVIRNINGAEVAYMLWRNPQSCDAGGWCDFREEATMGEMVLDSTTVPGYSAGDMRFVSWRDPQNPQNYFRNMQTDEMMYITGSGNALFHGHWVSAQAYSITDRSNSLGDTYVNPIKTSNLPNIIWRQVYCPPTNSQCNPQNFPGGSGFSYGPSNCPFDAIHRYCVNGLYSYGDQRGFPPGFYEYWNDSNGGSTPFVIVSANLVLVKTNDGAIIALDNGNPLAFANSSNLSYNQETQKDVLGDTIEKIPTISFQDAPNYVGKNVIVEGVLRSAVNRRPKAVYLGFTNPHDGALLIRVFEKDISQFSYDLMTLKGKKVRVKGFVTLYWPEGKDPEIIVTDPSQIEILQ